MISSLKEKLDQVSSDEVLRYSQKAQKEIDNEINFNYTETNDILKDLENEIIELKEELQKHTSATDNTNRIFEELGDVLFVLCNLANHFNINASNALKHSVDEFIRRILFCEQCCKNEYISFSKENVLKFWSKAKNTKTSS